MPRSLELVLLPEEAADKTAALTQASRQLGVAVDRIRLVVRKRSIDARGRTVKIRVFADAYIDEPVPETPDLLSLFSFDKDVSKATPIHLAGFGPAGMFAALRLIELGYKPVIIERGKDIRSRRRDLARLNKEGHIHPDSNYCFGEGGAGTYSDGKLYTRSGKRGDIQRILSLFVLHGADPDIMVDAHPHIGTNKLPHIVQSIRETILKCGGEIRFETKLIDLTLKDGKLSTITIEQLSTGQREELPTRALLLATGHSARDIFELLERRGIRIEAKPFALGVRIEHPQSVIDSVQYHCAVRSEYLPPASYSLTTQAEGRGVYSFCMCPGGIIAPAATAEGEVVVNGWSPSKRNNPFANSGMVVSIEPKDYEAFGSSPLSAMYYQQSVEQRAYKAGGGNLVAPAQRLMDFLHKKTSAQLPDTSYHPGVRSVGMDEVLPAAVVRSLRAGIKTFGDRMRPYLTNEAVLVATESRTSSPVRIPRDAQTLHHPEVEGLFPCGEGAGYAGGIVSAAMDGERCAEAIARAVIS